MLKNNLQGFPAQLGFGIGSVDDIELFWLFFTSLPDWLHTGKGMLGTVSAMHGFLISYIGGTNSLNPEKEKKENPHE